MRNWAELLPEMLYLISDRVSSLQDLAAFGGVCSMWRHVAVKYNYGLPFSPKPWLMLAENQDNELRDFYSVTERKIYSFKLPELKGKKCMETKGLIVTLSNEGEMALVQPLTRVQIHLPNVSRGDTDPLYAVQRTVLSSPPDPQNKRDWVLVILNGSSGEVGFCRSGDKVWTVVDNFGCGNQSLEYYRGKIYVGNHSGQVGEYDVVGKSNGFSPVSPRKTKIDFEEYADHDQSYIVSSRDSLFVIFREGIYQCSGFWVFEIDVEKESFKRVKSLGTRTIFLGHDFTLCVDTIRYPELIPNSIYFTDDFFERYAFEPEGGGMNMGVYSLEDKSVQSHYNGKSFSLICPPVWTYLTTK